MCGGWSARRTRSSRSRGMASFDKRLDAAKRLAGAHPRMIATGIEQELGTRFTIRHAARAEAAVSASSLCVADGERQSRADPALAALAADLCRSAGGRRDAPGERASRAPLQGGDPLQKLRFACRCTLCRRQTAGPDCHRSETKPRERDAIACGFRLAKMTDLWYCSSCGLYPLTKERLSCGKDWEAPRIPVFA